MKKTFTLLAMLPLLVTGCDFNAGKKKDDDPSHEHTYSEEWSYDNHYHWHDATCGHKVISDKAEHIFGEWVTDVEPTYEEEGAKHRDCTICDYAEQGKIDKLSVTLDKLAFTLNSDNESYSVAPVDKNVEGAVVIPDVFKGKPVTKIPDNVFNFCKKMTYIYIPDSVTYVGEGAFSYSEALATVRFPNGITEIKYNCFGNCKALAEFSIPDSVTKISTMAFYQSGLVSITIPDSVGSIYDDAFKGCSSLETLVVGSGISWINKCAFMNCRKLVNVTLKNSETNISRLGDEVFNGCWKLEEITFPDSYVQVGRFVFMNCSALKVINIGKGMAEHNQFAFTADAALEEINVSNENEHYCSLNGVLYNKNKTMLIRCPSAKSADYTIPNVVKEIDDGAFAYDPYLGFITIPNSVGIISIQAFHNCKSLVSVNLGKGVKEIHSQAFADCELLETLNYSGTKEDWGKIELASSWRDRSPLLTVVHCSDGDVEL